MLFELSCIGIGICGAGAYFNGAQNLAIEHLRQHNEVVRTKMAILSEKNKAFRDEIYRLRAEQPK